MRNPFRYFNSSPEVIRLTVMFYIRYPLSLRQVEDILFERSDEGIARISINRPAKRNAFRPRAMSTRMRRIAMAATAKK